MMKRVRIPGDGAVMNTSAGLDLAAATFRWARSRSSALRSLYFSGPTQPGNGDAEKFRRVLPKSGCAMRSRPSMMSRPFSAARGSCYALDSVADVGGVGWLAHLAVADDVDAR